jgi:hypothetical protein
MGTVIYVVRATRYVYGRMRVVLLYVMFNSRVDLV